MKNGLDILIAFISKHILGTAIFVIGLPFILLSLGEIYSFGGFRTFGLDLKDFITAWIAFWGVIGVAINAYLMYKRVTEQEKQTQLQQKNQEIQQKQFKEQIELQQKQLRDSRFSSSVELLGNGKESVRIGGIHSLYFLAKEHQDEYLETVCEILCAHVCTITNYSKYQEKYKYKPSKEIQIIINLLFKEYEGEDRDKENPFLNFYNSDYDEDLCDYDYCEKNLERAFLNGVDFGNAKLHNVNLNSARLTDVNFNNAKLDDVKFFSATLIDVHFNEATLTNIIFISATLRIVHFNETTLTNIYFTYYPDDPAELTEVRFNNAKLNNVKFKLARLTDVDFSSTKLANVDFSYATLYNTVNFKGTCLEEAWRKGGYKEITKEGRSLELTKKED